ncbi:MAG: GMP/IMP nucleotidase, partial [Gammaproteobacteria bacterium]|nr:GMP/IMP nucleotidase [Gammaproteobacteria bacterium]
MIDWNRIHTVLLDMDGTLLDLNFDTFFWREHVPLRYAEKHTLEIDEAKQQLFPKFQQVEGTMDWYCVDYWSGQLGLDIASLKAEIDHLIAIHPHVLDFLDQLRQHNKKAVLVTNAHQKSLMLKLDRTQLHNHLDQIICAHDYGMPKEETVFWDKLKQDVDYENATTLLVDDSLPVLRSAQRYGIEHLLCVHKPDSQNPAKDVEEFNAIHSFKD